MNPKYQKYLKKIITIGLILSLICILNGCSSPSKNQQAQKQQANLPPKELTEIQDNLDTLFEGLRTAKRRTATQKSAEQGQQQGPQQTDQQGDQKESEGQNQQNKKQTTESQIEWKKNEQLIEEIHQNWNAFEPQAIKNGIRPEIITRFENQINLLTIKVIDRERYESQLAANNAAQYIPDFLELFETGSPSDLSRLKYLTRDVMLKVEANNWDEAESIINEMPLIWSRIRNEMKNKDEESMTMIEFAITDLSNAIKTKEKALVRIKADILERNLNNLKDKLEE